MTNLDYVRDTLLSIRQSGVDQFGLIQLAEMVRERKGGWIYEDTCRKYLRDLLALEIPTEKVKKGVYRFLSKPVQNQLWGQSNEQKNCRYVLSPKSQSAQ
jgi:hypothetical protein